MCPASERELSECVQVCACVRAHEGVSACERELPCRGEKRGRPPGVTFVSLMWRPPGPLCIQVQGHPSEPHLTQGCGSGSSGRRPGCRLGTARVARLGVAPGKRAPVWVTGCRWRPRRAEGTGPRELGAGGSFLVKAGCAISLRGPRAPCRPGGWDSGPGASRSPDADPATGRGTQR